MQASHLHRFFLPSVFPLIQAGNNDEIGMRKSRKKDSYVDCLGLSKTHGLMTSSGTAYAYEYVKRSKVGSKGKKGLVLSWSGRRILATILDFAQSSNSWVGRVDCSAR